MAMNEELVYGKNFKKLDIIERLNSVKPSHGSFRKCQDAIKALKAKDQRIAELEARVKALEAQLTLRAA